MKDIVRGVGAGLQPAVAPLLCGLAYCLWLFVALPLIFLVVIVAAEYPSDSLKAAAAIVAICLFVALRDWQAKKGVSTPFLDGIEEGAGHAISLIYCLVWLALVAALVFGPVYYLAKAYLWVTHGPG